MITPTQLLWQRFGSAEHPAEWDGRDGNGGKGSQRFWEYLWTLQQLGNAKSVLDVGGGKGFFATLLNDINIMAFVVDPLGRFEFDSCTTIEDLVEQNKANGLNPKFYDAVVCVSVLEHVTDKPAFCAALDSFDAPIAMTFEFGPGAIEQKEVYSCLAMFKNHHLNKMELCPVIADNSSRDAWRPLGVVLMPNL